jgi:hypothetical protein
MTPAPSLIMPQAAASVLGLSKRFGKTNVLEISIFTWLKAGAGQWGRQAVARRPSCASSPDWNQPYRAKLLHGRDVTELPARSAAWVDLSIVCTFSDDGGKNIGYGLRIRKRRRKEKERK